VYRHVVLDRNCTEKPPGHICKYPDKITRDFGVIICDSSIRLYYVSVFVCVFHYSDTLWGGGGLLKNLYSALCCDLVGRLLQL
jgi:hypothetical protein